MKILMYADGFGVKTQTFITQDIHYLSQNHEILFICTKKDSNTPIPNVTVKQIHFKQNLLQRKLWQYDISLSFKSNYYKKEVTKIIEEFKPDVIHCQFGIESIKFIDNLEDLTIPLCIQFRGYDASRMLHKKSYVKRLQEILDRENYYSIFVADSLRKNLNTYQINTEKSMILHSGIDLTKFEPTNSISNKKDSFIFLQISSLNEKKGHIYTLEAFARFLASQKSKNFILKLTGEGPNKTKLEKLAIDLNIQNNVEFIGFVSHKEAKTLLEEADVFVHHSITPDDGDEEGIPNAIIEAMAMKLPILSTYHAGISELVADGVNGYLIEEKDIENYALRMNNVLSWNKLDINREVVTKEFEINYHINKLENFYSQMINTNIFS
jgi:glycosyltransferase involved in cell wall biosynthesis